MRYLPAFLTGLYFTASVLQFFATISGLQHWWGLHWFFSGFVALFVCGIPVLGSITGFMGAVKGWGWSYLGAGILFFGLPLGMLGLFLYEKFAAAMSQTMGRNNKD